MDNDTVTEERPQTRIRAFLSRTRLDRTGTNYPGTCYLTANCYDGDPAPRLGRAFPPEKTQREVERIWKRISAQEAQP